MKGQLEHEQESVLMMKIKKNAKLDGHKMRLAMRLNCAPLKVNLSPFLKSKMKHDSFFYR